MRILIAFVVAAHFLTAESVYVVGLKVFDTTVTTVHIDGKERLKCVCIDEFSKPLLSWHDSKFNDVSGGGTWELTDLGDGRKKLESVLNMEVEANDQYFCQVVEWGPRRNPRAVISDGEPLIVPEDKLP